MVALSKAAPTSASVATVLAAALDMASSCAAPAGKRRARVRAETGDWAARLRAETLSDRALRATFGPLESAPDINHPAVEEKPDDPDLD